MKFARAGQVYVFLLDCPAEESEEWGLFTTTRADFMWVGVKGWLGRSKCVGMSRSCWGKEPSVVGEKT